MSDSDTDDSNTDDSNTDGISAAGSDSNPSQKSDDPHQSSDQKPAAPSTSEDPVTTNRPEEPPLPDGSEEESELIEEGQHRSKRVWLIGATIAGVIFFAAVAIVYTSGGNPSIADQPSADPAPSSTASQLSSSKKLSPAKKFAKTLMKKEYNWGDDEFPSLDSLWEKESGWNPLASGPGGAYGIPQALPGSKMKSKGEDWKTNYKTQIKWGLEYIHDRYGSPTAAWNTSQRTGGY